MNSNLTSLKLRNSSYEIPTGIKNKCTLVSMIGINKIRPFKAFIASEQRSIKDWEALVRHFLDTYIGEYASREDYAKAYLNEGSEFEKIPPFLRGYFDYFLYARELFSSVVYDLKAQRGIYVFLSCKPVSD